MRAPQTSSAPPRKRRRPAVVAPPSTPAPKEEARGETAQRRRVRERERGRAGDTRTRTTAGYVTRPQTCESVTLREGGPLQRYATWRALTTYRALAMSAPHSPAAASAPPPWPRVAPQGQSPVASRVAPAKDFDREAATCPRDLPPRIVPRGREAITCRKAVQTPAGEVCKRSLVGGGAGFFLSEVTL